MTAWSGIEAMLGGILDRGWYTNHGPMAQALERRAAAHFATPHAIIATNPTIALLMLADALHLENRVLVPANAPPCCTQALIWSGLEPAPFDPAKPLPIGSNTTAILATPSPHQAEWAAFAAAHGLAFYSFGPNAVQAPAVITLPAWGDEAGIACITTNDETLAAVLRNIRSSYGAGPPVPVRRTANGRVSEIQAATALLALGEP